MANNRLYLYQPSSGKHVFLAKNMGEEWYTNFDDLSERLDRFFEDTWLEDDGYYLELRVEHSDFHGDTRFKELE
jgi:hypothetical protein|tara:strand:+ start:282 stop:503 length:222 start_codon:yes stop_codon:yes gene_type:complete